MSSSTQHKRVKRVKHTILWLERNVYWDLTGFKTILRYAVNRAYTATAEHPAFSDRHVEPMYHVLQRINKIQ